ncbi:unnamed protein product [Haemonchus placei]|uniref:SCP domain-containing protein n=1 Tax=Haemonchus placei TaxID=6290 RepID=A0A0N4X1B3_HAEPC|nr:unnamed protein product [Haemonchus placei]
MFLVITLLIITLANHEAHGMDHELPPDLKSTFEEINEQHNAHLVRHLPKETTYGCGGILDTEGRSDLMYVACLYNKRK